MNEIGKIVEGFPNYEVTNYGRVFNLATGRELTLSPTKMDGEGDFSVGFFRGGVQHRFSVKCLVARMFVEGEDEVFNTPVLLDGDRYNLRADNIVWRPRWFACTYVRQFRRLEPWVYLGPILDTVNNVEYENILEAGVQNGVLFKDIMESLWNEKRVFPTRQRFVRLEK